MSGTQQRPETSTASPPFAGATPGSTGFPGYGRGSAVTPTGWVGWIVFAGTMLTLMGGIQAIEGLAALFHDGYYLVTPDGLVVNVDYTAWGWVHLILGLVAVAAGFGMLFGQMWARVVGVIIAAASILLNVAFLAAYPVWATIVITFDVIVIYALTVHGRETKVAIDN
jgi:hypothetical protein